MGSSGSFAHTGNEIDFNGSANDGNKDLGRTVVAAAAGTVVTSAYQTSNGFGNLVKIRHSDGSTTLYAHLNARSVGQGASVKQGQKIGTVGHSSAKYNLVAHLHYEQRSSSGKNVKTSFNGATFKYPGQKITSKNCGGGAAPPKSTSANPYTAAKVCGAGFGQVDSAPLGSQGRVYLMYSSATGQNCVATVRNSVSGTVAASAYLEVRGKARQTDSGKFQYYAGPVRAKAVRTCVKWGGSIGSARYDSPFEHCG
ncbi:peptidase M23 [Sphaerisporangium melleum]|uniref:M23 family metallopeptidase n=1 Tax=Sphaerisporangium melleum TaxID=321316 RepID=UPI001A4F3A02|nr:M23 family metallopeptidase [Sphaerisporangium melleum]GII69873.1 peptidase M23 [Sphaerisporangium melleum]